jgi:hypothetical protein
VRAAWARAVARRGLGALPLSSRSGDVAPSPSRLRMSGERKRLGMSAG